MPSLHTIRHYMHVVVLMRYTVLAGSLTLRLQNLLRAWVVGNTCGRGKPRVRTPGGRVPEERSRRGGAAVCRSVTAVPARRALAAVARRSRLHPVYRRTHFTYCATDVIPRFHGDIFQWIVNVYVHDSEWLDKEDSCLRGYIWWCWRSRFKDFRLGNVTVLDSLTYF